MTNKHSTPNVHVMNPLLDLCETQGIVSLDSSGLDGGEVAAIQQTLLDFYGGKTVLFSKTPADTKRLKKELSEFSDFCSFANGNDASVLEDLTGYYGIIVCGQTDKISEYTKYLLALKAEEFGLRMVMIY